jgi:hypothetical protein
MTNAGDDQTHESPRWVQWFFWVAIALGIVGRLVWVSDMEWKEDEIYSFVHARSMGKDQPWAKTGMNTSLGIPNPGLSIWAFVPLVRIASTPEGLCRVVMFLNVIALIGFAVLLLRDSKSREAWYWTIAIYAVNPYVVRIARKIWPPSLLAPLILAFFVGHKRRDRCWGSFLWGLSGALIGQIHLSGFFLAGGVSLWTLIEGIRGKAMTRWRYGWWIAGSLLGAVGLIPWVSVLRKDGEGAPFTLGWTIESLLLRLRVVGEDWFSLAFGLTSWWTYYHDEGRFLETPTFFGIPTQGAWMATSLLTLIGAFGVISWCAGKVVSGSPRRSQRIPFKLTQPLRRFRRSLPRLAKGVASYFWLYTRALIRPRRSLTGPIGFDLDARFWLRATFLVFSTLLILASRIIHLHYIYTFTPFLFLSVVVLFRKRRGFLAAIVVLQAALTAMTLVDIHRQGGSYLGDYRTSYRAQGRPIP